MRSRIKTVQKEQAVGKSATLLAQVENKIGRIPNIYRILAHSPIALESYVNLTDLTQHEGTLDRNFVEKLALTVSEANNCEYCVSAHASVAKQLRLSNQEIEDARRATSQDAKEKRGLEFARKIVEERGGVSDEDVEKLRHVGYTDGQIVEIILNVVVNTFTNYMNHVAATEVDFPVVEPRYHVEKTI